MSEPVVTPSIESGHAEPTSGVAAGQRPRLSIVSSATSISPPLDQEITLVGTPKPFVMDLESGSSTGEVSGLLELRPPRASSAREEEATFVGAPSEALLRECARPSTNHQAPRARGARALWEGEDEATVVNPTIAVGNPFAVDDDATVITRVGSAPARHGLGWPSPPDQVPPPAPSPPAVGSVAEGVSPDGPRQRVDALFATPPELPQRAAATGEGSWSWRALPSKKRRRVLLLAFVLMAGAWLMFLRPGAPLAPAPAARGGLVGVEAAPASLPVLPEVQLPDATGPVELSVAAEHLAGARFGQALPLYRALAAEHPEQPVFEVIQRILAREVAERCRQKGGSECQ